MTLSQKIDEMYLQITCIAHVINKTKYLYERWERLPDSERAIYTDYFEYNEVKTREAIQEFLEGKA